MEIGKHKALNWIVIALMVMMPLRSVLAVTQAACDMHAQSLSVEIDHSMHAMHQANQPDQADTAVIHDCCDSAMHCNNECSVGTTVSFISPPTISLPTSTEAVIHTRVNDDLVFREITPPVRPPAYL